MALEAWQAISELFEQVGERDYVGEPVSQKEHSLQAARFASDATKSDNSYSRREVVLASLLHDIGHMLALQRPGTERMGDCGAMHHEVIGGDHLRALRFSPRVAKLVSQHVNAKRYLVAVKPEYAAKLSAASTTTLGYQGGPFTPEECTAFEQDPDKVSPSFFFFRQELVRMGSATAC
jgi:2-amino-1-hydroxyethylphosphonate dioxygenase (glycine-forming)